MKIKHPYRWGIIGGWIVGGMVAAAMGLDHNTGWLVLAEVAGTVLGLFAAHVYTILRFERNYRAITGRDAWEDYRAGKPPLFEQMLEEGEN